MALRAFTIIYAREVSTLQDFYSALG